MTIAGCWSHNKSLTTSFGCCSPTIIWRGLHFKLVTNNFITNICHQHRRCRIRSGRLAWCSVFKSEWPMISVGNVQHFIIIWVLQWIITPPPSSGDFSNLSLIKHTPLEAEDVRIHWGTLMIFSNKYHFTVCPLLCETRIYQSKRPYYLSK